ncbi:MAG: NAD(P)-dependent oxidoreductase [Opitutae bacterium]|nr:NAD(P)-dependent oxidoreductase [Opitutae bacterium]MBT7922900.1 NAD(P)-dependent oxidoreductase [Opitutae bacterium]
MHSVSDSRIGFIGLGNMGKPMARHLMRAGARITLFNRSKQVLEELAGEGADVASSPSEAAQGVGDGLIFLSLPNASSVGEVVEGEDGLFAGLATGSKVIDMGSTAVEATRGWQEKALGIGSDWIDAPVSGGQKGAREANLTIMAGGREESVNAIRPVLGLLGTTITYMGPSGAGQCAKLANQVIVASTIASLSEAFLLCRENGVDLKATRTALLGGFAQSKILHQHGLRMIEEDFEPGGTAINQLKDLVEASNVATANKLTLPMLETNKKLWERMIEDGLGELDHSGLYEWYRKLEKQGHDRHSVEDQELPSNPN